MTLRLAKLQNLLWRCKFAQTAQFASMAWRTAYFNYGISGLCTVVYVISCRNFWLQYRSIQDGGPNKHGNVSSFYFARNT